MFTRGRLNKLLKERGLTQSDISEKTGIPQGTISRFDRNIRHDTDNLILIARFLNIPIEELFDIIEEDLEEAVKRGRSEIKSNDK